MTDSDPPARRAALLGSGLALALDSITEPWCNAILRAAFLGVRKFDGFLQTLSLPRQTLSLRLRYLCRIGLLEHSPRDRAGMKPGYRLTEAGKSLYPNVLASWSWDRRWGHFTGRLPTQLNHRPCGHAFSPQLMCEHCGQPMTPGNTTALLVSEATHHPVRVRGRYRGHTHSRQAEPGRRDLLAVIDDRWSVLLIAAA
ncbi:MAG: winged helix-turn-helix transcriptional regulator, partial [Rhodoferax sp.]|nr:winged helix-turn-helix transcriptional regulator [Rhodoferax sp.]